MRQEEKKQKTMQTEEAAPKDTVSAFTLQSLGRLARSVLSIMAMLTLSSFLCREDPLPTRTELQTQRASRQRLRRTKLSRIWDSNGIQVRKQAISGLKQC